MPKFKEIEVSPLELKLDTKNPRFIVPVNPTQADVRAHLLRHEGVAALAYSIVEFGGLMPGERTIVCKENGEYVVLEGNRRVCACQLLLDRSLIPAGFEHDIPTASPALKADLSTIRVDIIASREEADTILATRHIEGIKQWPPLAKMKFFVSRFEAGLSLEQISRVTNIDKSDIKTAINQFYLLKQALDLPSWTSSQRKGPLEWYNLEVNRFTRLFYTKGAAAALGLSFDETTLKPKWAWPEDVVNKILELIVDASLIKRTVNTRATIHQVPGLIDLLRKVKESKATVKQPETPQKAGAEQLEEPLSTQNPGGYVSLQQPSRRQSKELKQHAIDLCNHSSSDINTALNSGTSNPLPLPKTAGFFEALTANKLDPRDPDAIGIIQIASEIRDISHKTLLKRFPNAAAMLLRTLLEQALKYNVKKMGQWTSLLNRFNGKDPGLKDLINYYNANLGTLLPDSQVQRIFKAVFDHEGIKNSLDLIVHHPNITTATPEILSSIAKAGMFGLIQALLN